jgi:hypothetical protein
MPSPSHSSWLHDSDNIWWEVQIIKLLIKQSSSLPCYLVPLTTLFSNMLSLCFFLSVRDQVSHPYETTRKIIVVYILIFIFLEEIDW